MHRPRSFHQAARRGPGRRGGCRPEHTDRIAVRTLISGGGTGLPYPSLGVVGGSLIIVDDGPLSAPVTLADGNDLRTGILKVADQVLVNDLSVVVILDEPLVDDTLRAPCGSRPLPSVAGAQVYCFACQRS